MMKNAVILILDKMAYREYENEYMTVLKEKYDAAQIVYTEYEDNVIRKVRGWRYVGSMLQHLLYWMKSLNYANKIMKMQAADIICINPIVGIFLGLMNSKKRKFNITFCGFLFEPKKSKVYYNARKWVVNRALKGVKNAVVYASQEVEYYEKIFEIKNKFRFVQYGIDYLVENKYSKELPKSYIFSGGGSNRDYKTLFEAYKLGKAQHLLPPLYIATLPKCVADLDTSGIKILTDVVLETFGDVERQSDFVILSLKDTEISAGHQVMLEALKNNCIVIINRISAVEDYVNDDQVVFFESGNAEDLKDKVIYLISHYDEMKKKFKDNSKYYRENFTFSALLNRLIEL